MASAEEAKGMRPSNGECEMINIITNTYETVKVLKIN